MWTSRGWGSRGGGGNWGPAQFYWNCETVNTLKWTGTKVYKSTECLKSDCRLGVGSRKLKDWDQTWNLKDMTPPLNFETPGHKKQGRTNTSSPGSYISAKRPGVIGSRRLWAIRWVLRVIEGSIQNDKEQCGDRKGSDLQQQWSGLMSINLKKSWIQMKRSFEAKYYFALCTFPTIKPFYMVSQNKFKSISFNNNILLEMKMTR